METDSFKNKIKYSIHVLFHPFNGFYELKYERRSSPHVAALFLAVYFISVVLRESCSGYLFSGNTGSAFSIFTCALKALAPITLFCLSNWCLTLLLNGEAKMGQLFTALCYAIVPVIIYNLLFTALSNILSLEENLYLQLINVVCLLWTGFLVLIAVMETNQYSFMKAIASCLMAIVGIAILLLIFLLCGDIITQVFSFIYSIIKELSYR